MRRNALALAAALALVAAPLRAAPLPAEDAFARWLARGGEIQPVAPPLLDGLVRVLGDDVGFGEGGFLATGDGVELAWKLGTRRPSGRCDARRAEVVAFARQQGLAVEAPPEWATDATQLGGTLAGRRYRIVVEARELTGAPECEVAVSFVVVVPAPQPLSVEALFGRYPALGRAAELPAFLAAELARRPVHSLACSGFPETCTYWSFELAERDPKAAIRELVAVGEQHGFACEDKTEDPQADWIQSFQACSGAYLQYRILDGRVALTLQPSSGAADARDMVTCSASATPAPPPAGADPRVRDVPIRAWHLAHVDKVATCFQRHRKTPTARLEWEKLGNFLRFLVVDEGLAPAPTEDRLPKGAAQAELDVLHYPYAGTPAFGFGARLVARGADDVVVALWFRQEGATIVGGASTLSYAEEGVRLWAVLAEADPGAVLRDEATLRRAVESALSAEKARDIEKIADLTTCNPEAAPICERIPASADEKAAARDRLDAEYAARSALLARRAADFLARARALYPFADPACALPLPRKTLSE